MYVCTYDTAAKWLTIIPKGMTDEIVCGSVDGEDRSFNTEEMTDDMPSIKLNGLSTTEKDAYYTLILSNPDDSIPIKPIIHQIIGNVKGSDLATGDISKGTEIKEYRRPNPPILWFQFHYIYLVYK